MKEYIKEIIQLQKSIITIFKSIYPEVKDYNLLLDFPRKGELEVHGQTWVFTKHGKGLKFLRKDPLPEIIVNIHNYFSEPEVLDKWRLEQYLESINVPYTKDDISQCLDELTSAHVFKKISEQHYKLNCDAGRQHDLSY